ncbi:hypothetical protein CCQ62_23490 [Salmonella enterica]|nr:hypothetical protein [Salmonella enterica]
MTESTESKFITDQAKASIVTANGIILAFALAFFSNWCMSGASWSKNDMPTLFSFSFGLNFLIFTLYRTLMPYRQTIKHYEQNVRLLILGIVFIFVGVILVIKN